MEVRTQVQLADALNDERVTNVVFMPENWDLSAEQLPHHAAVIRNRRVLLEGAVLPGGKLVHIDVSLGHSLQGGCSMRQRDGLTICCDRPRCHWPAGAG